MKPARQSWQASSSAGFAGRLSCFRTSNDTPAMRN
jgi:hypothetical protein